MVGILPVREDSEGFDPESREVGGEVRT